MTDLDTAADVEREEPGCWPQLRFWLLSAAGIIVTGSVLAGVHWLACWF